MPSRLTRNQRYVLRCLSIDVRDFAPRHTISLRILQERGLVQFSIGPQRWSLTRDGRDFVNKQLAA